MSLLDILMNRNSPLPESTALGNELQSRFGPMEPSVLGGVFSRSGGRDALEQMMNEKKLQDFALRKRLMDLLEASKVERASRLPAVPPQRIAPPFGGEFVR